MDLPLQIPATIPSQLSASAHVYRDECTFSFDGPLLPRGIDVDLISYRAYSRSRRDYTGENYARTGHQWYLNIQQVPLPIEPLSHTPPTKMARLEIQPDTPDTSLETILSVYDAQSQTLVAIQDLTPDFQALAIAVSCAESGYRREEIETWRHEISDCAHSKSIVQTPRERELSALASCDQCDLAENLWICLECGTVSCGRAQFGTSVQGNSHALKHFEECRHAVAVKLGSLEAGSPSACDAYCYVCGDEVRVPDLSRLLQTFDINLEHAVKTEKTLVELNIDQNLNWEFQLDGANGERLEPVFGPGLTGLANLGNSCYMNSVLQLLFSTRAYRGHFASVDVYSETADPYLSMLVQLAKLQDGLWSGDFSIPNPLRQDQYQLGLKPYSFKSLVGCGHPEFAGPQQQDASEFLSYVMDKVDRSLGLDVNRDFQLVIADTLSLESSSGQSGSVTYLIVDNLALNVPTNILATNEESGTVTYQETSFAECLDEWLAAQIVDGFVADDGTSPKATKHTGMYLLPSLLVVSLQRIKLENWIPVKVSVPVQIPHELDMSPYILEPGQMHVEPKVPEPENTFVPLPQALASLTDMGFGYHRCARALYNTGNSNVEDATTWIFAHMDDIDVDEPFKVPANSPAHDSVDAASIQALEGMGFAAHLAKKALSRCSNNVESAVEWLFNNPDGGADDAGTGTGAGAEETRVVDADKERRDLLAELRAHRNLNGQYRLSGVICHKGTSPHTGHYVAYIRKTTENGGQWVLFNDEKVVVCDDSSLHEIETNGYVYLFEQVAKKDENAAN